MDKSGWVCSETPLRPTDGLLKIRFERTRGAPFSSKLGGYGPKSGCCARIKTKIRPFLPKTGWVSAGMALFSHEKRDTFYWIFYRNQWVGMLRFIQVVKPVPYAKGIYPPGVLSANDIKGVKSFYPEIAVKNRVELQLDESIIVKATSGGQDDFVFTAPSTQKYTFSTAGSLDTVMVVSEMAETENFYMSGDDDSGFDKNSKVTLPLVKGRSYLIHLRVLYAPEAKSGSMVVSEVE
jgi:hypothetical protein